MPREDRLLTLEEVASRLGVSHSTVKRLIKRGHLTGFRVGRNLRVSTSSLDSYTSTKRSYVSFLPEENVTAVTQAPQDRPA